MHRIRTVIAVFIASYTLCPLGALAEKPAPDLKAGRATYATSCARCHGVAGQGDGLDAQRLYPKPRNLTLGVYKFRSTASGSPPTDDDIFRTLTHGLPGTRMPSWGQLDEATRWQLVYYVKSLAPSLQEQPPQPVAIAPDPGPKHADLAKGQQLYKDLGCVQCHGPAGRGNGPSSATLTDDWEQPIQAADVTQGWNYRSGNEPRDIALRLLTGIDGTPMPSYVDAIPGEDAWHLAYYVRSLQPEPRWLDHVQVARVPALPSSWNDAQWAAASRTDVRLGGTVYADGAVAPTRVNALSVQAFHDGATLALRLTWHDRTDSRAQIPDAIAVALRPESVRGDVISLQAWPSPEAPALDTLVWSAAATAAAEQVGFDFAATGLPAVPNAAQAGAAARPSEAHYEDGAWIVVVRRALSPADLPGAVALTPERPVAVAFACWDGGNLELGRKRSVSYWINLQLQP